MLTIDPKDHVEVPDGPYRVRIRSEVTTGSAKAVPIAADDLASFDVTIDELLVHVTPRIAQMAVAEDIIYAEGDEGVRWHEEPHIFEIDAEAEVATHPRLAMGRQERAAIRHALIQVLQRTLSQLRVRTHILAIDPHAPGRAPFQYWDAEQGEWRWVSHTINFSDMWEDLSIEVWNDSIAQVQKAIDTEVSDELFHESRFFRDQGNNRMAVLCAAIAAEACTYRMLVSSLAKGRVSRADAESLIANLSRRTEQPVLSDYFDLIPEDLKTPLNELINWRNQIAHGLSRKLIERERAEAAIHTARKVREAYEVFKAKRAPITLPPSEAPP